ncbi:hypothetical protein GCM10014715_66110 [Streptomyces spiralis]|uniref:Uncharacterized protein n=1 Tax=Streptomyces spiralis TaxID=66376 RepID=A0A919AD02_9ACTN|nr:hypothetical protein GCM10014715_66110 [Streptomyces spiralis]
MVSAGRADRAWDTAAAADVCMTVVAGHRACPGWRASAQWMQGLRTKATVKSGGTRVAPPISRKQALNYCGRQSWQRKAVNGDAVRCAACLPAPGNKHRDQLAS